MLEHFRADRVLRPAAQWAGIARRFQQVALEEPHCGNFFFRNPDAAGAELQAGDLRTRKLAPQIHRQIALPAADIENPRLGRASVTLQQLAHDAPAVALPQISFPLPYATPPPPLP